MSRPLLRAVTLASGLLIAGCGVNSPPAVGEETFEVAGGTLN